MIPQVLTAQDLTPAEIQKLQEIRDSLRQEGFLQNSEIETAEASGVVALVEYSSYTNNYLNVDDAVSPRGSDFKPDGTRFYILGRSSQNIVEYHLSNDWNIETASYERELDISPELGNGSQPDVAANGLFFRGDGRMMWVVNRTEIWEYSLSSAWDITSAYETGYHNFDDVVVRSHDMHISPNGRILYIDDRIQESIFQFNLSNSWDIESASLDYVLDISDQNDAVRGTYLSPDGKRMFLNDTGRQEVLEYYLSDSFDLHSASYVGSYDLSSQVTNNEGFTFRPDLSMFYVTSTSEERVYQYRVRPLGSGQSSIAKSNDNVPANGNRSSRITVTARTPDGDEIQGIEISLHSDSDNVDINKVNSSTNSDGEAIFDVSNTNAESVTFTASGFGTTIDQSVSVQFISADPNESTVASNREKVVANGSAVSRITVTARDEDGDRLEDMKISLSANSDNVDIDVVQGETNNDGEAIFEVSNTVPETVEFKASNLGTTFNQRVSVRFVTVDAAESSVASSQQKVHANSLDTSTITVIARDEDGDELEGVEISLIPDGGNSDIEAVQEVTNSDGEAEFKVSNSVAENVTYQARGFGVTIDDEVTVNFIPIDPDESDMTISTQKILANGSAEATITVTARDEDGNPFNNIEINLQQNGGNSTVTNVQKTTDEDGTAIFRVKNDNVAEITYSASAFGTTISQTVVAKFVTVDPAQSTAVANPERVQANGEEESHITVTTRDSDGDVLQGARVVLQALNGNSAIVDNDQITDAEGKAEFVVINDIPQIVNYRVTAEGNQFPDNVSVSFIPIAPVALSANQVQTRQFQANWELVNGAESYLIDVATDSAFTNLVNPYDALDVGNVTSFTVDNVSPGTTYLYRVRATSVGLIGANSQIIQTTTFPDTPEAISASDRNALKFTANWNEAEGARKYRLDVARDASFNNIITEYDDLDVGNTTSFTVTNLRPGENYYYRVRSEAGPRTSGSSNIVETSTLTISGEESEITSSQLRVLANGVQPNTITITVRSDGGVLLEGLNVDLNPQSGNSQVEEVQPITSEEGVAVFNVTSTSAEAVEYSIIVENIDIGTIRLEFVPDEGVLALGNNFPNPFLVNSKIPLTVPRPMEIELRVYNSLGAPVRTLKNEQMDTGYYEIPFNGADLAAGVYFYRLRADGEVKTRKMVLVK